MNKVQVYKMPHSWSPMWTILKIKNRLMKHASVL